MRQIIILTAITMPGAALADPGHLGELAGHSHWIALGALGLAAAIGAIAAVKGAKGGEEAEEASSDDTAEPQEA